MFANYARFDFGEFLDVDALAAGDRANVGYRHTGEFPETASAEGNPLQLRNITGRPGLEVDPENTRLCLGDTA